MVTGPMPRNPNATRPKANTAGASISAPSPVVLTYLASWALIPNLGDGSLWWKLSTVITCGTLAGAIIPELVKVFTSTESSHVREVVTSSREGGASLNVLSGFVAGNFSAYWLGIVIVLLMGIAFAMSTGLAVALNVLPAPSFSSSSAFALSKLTSSAKSFFSSC